MKRSMILAVILGLLACTEGHAQAQMAREGPFKMRCGDALVKSLGLTDAQTAALSALQTQTDSAAAAVHSQAKTIHERIHTALSSASPDRCAIGDLMIQGAALHGQVETTLSNAEATFVGSLTADQKSKYDALLAAHPGCRVFDLPMHPPAF